MYVMVVLAVAWPRTVRWGKQVRRGSSTMLLSDVVCGVTYSPRILQSLIYKMRFWVPEA